MAMAKRISTNLLKNRVTTEKQKEQLFRQNLIEFIKKQDYSFKYFDFSAYNITQLVLLKVDMEMKK